MPGLFLSRSRPWLWATAAEGGLKSAPVSRLRGADPHRLSSYARSAFSSFACSWRTVTGKPDRTRKSGNVRLGDQPTNRDIIARKRTHHSKRGGLAFEDQDSKGIRRPVHGRVVQTAAQFAFGRT